MFLHKIQIFLNFLYVCQSFSWLTSLLKLDKYKDISSSEWYIFLKLFGDIPGMLVHLFQMNLNFFGGIPGMFVHLFQIVLIFQLEIQIYVYFLD